MAPSQNHNGHQHDGHCCCHQHETPQEVDKDLLDTAAPGRAVYRIMNMDCPVEEALIRKKLATLTGITALDFRLMQRVLVVEHTLPSAQPIESALKAIGMTPEPLGTASAASAEPVTPRQSRLRLGLAALLAALAEGAHLLHEGLGDLPVMPLWLAPLLAFLAIALSGTDTYRRGWQALAARDLNINALMSVAVTGAFCIGQFPEAAMVMVLFTISEAMEAGALQHARRAIRNLMALAPETALVLQPDGRWQDTPIRQVPVGSRVRVKPGQKVALDGTVLRGQSSVDQSPITGESMPVEKREGDPLYAGTLNQSSELEYAVTALATDSTLARIIHAVEEAQGSRAPLQRLVDSFARWYTPVIFCLALLTAILMPLVSDTSWLEALYTALVILVIGCPCALVISTPVTIVSGLAAASRMGILVKGGLFLEQGRRLNRLALDKTGTLTRGQPRQTACCSLGDLPEDTVQLLAGSLASHSDHPVSRAIAAHTAEVCPALLPVDGMTAHAGQGISGQIEGQTWFLGKPATAAMTEKPAIMPSMPATDAMKAQISALEQQGQTVSVLCNAHGPQALFAVADTLRPESVAALRELKALGVGTIMLTGDNARTAQAIAMQAGVDDFRADLLPQDKMRLVEELEATGHVVGMAGDGINDAPALARAHIGFAMAAGGTDTAMDTADVALMDDDLRKIPRFIRLSRRTCAILYENMALALGIKALFLALTFAGHATMWMAVFADVGTSLLVIANGLRALRPPRA